MNEAWRVVKGGLHERAEDVVRWIFPLARKCSPHELGVGSLDGEPGDSLRVCVSGGKVGVWCDFAGGDVKGSNLLELLIKVRGYEEHPERGLLEAADFLGIRGQVEAEWERKVAEDRARDAKAGRGGKKDGERGRIVKTYAYVDASGKLVHETVRFEPKSFAQRRPCERGEEAGGKRARWDDGAQCFWLWTLAGIEPVLYGLPRILAAGPEEWIWVTEGEKDADTLLGLGLIGTTCAMGAGKWRRSYSEVLAGRRVVICPDSDEAGMKHVWKVADELQEMGCRFAVVEWGRLAPGRLDEKWDVTRWLEECGNAKAVPPKVGTGD